MIVPGRVVVLQFPGVQATKRRPAVVISSDAYHQARPDCVVGLVTSNLASSNCPTDHLLQQWQAAGLHQPSAFRCFLWTVPRQLIHDEIGNLAESDWKEIQLRLKVAIATA
jgi:mRNA interferase MazF